LLAWNIFVSTSKEFRIHGRTLGTALYLGAQADARDATQVLGRGGQAAAHGNSLSRVLGRGAEAVARGTGSSASQVLDRYAEAASHGTARCASHVLDHGANATDQIFACDDAMLAQQEKKTRQMNKERSKHYQLHLSRVNITLML
jgi:hypothetical protein